MPRLWGRASSSNVQKVMWALAELGVEHERIDAGGRYGKVDTPEYGRLNPVRRVPVWEEDGLVLWESQAILRHLARTRGGVLAPEGSVATAIADQWLDFNATTLQPALIGVFWQVVRLPHDRRDAATLAGHLAALGGAIDVLEGRLAMSPWLGGERFSVAEIGAGTMMYRYFDMEIDRPDRPSVARWYAALSERPAYRTTVMTSYDELRAG